MDAGARLRWQERTRATTAGMGAGCISNNGGFISPAVLSLSLPLPPPSYCSGWWALAVWQGSRGAYFIVLIGFTSVSWSGGYGDTITANPNPTGGQTGGDVGFRATGDRPVWSS